MSFWSTAGGYQRLDDERQRDTYAASRPSGGSAEAFDPFDPFDPFEVDVMVGDLVTSPVDSAVALNWDAAELQVTSDEVTFNESLVDGDADSDPHSDTDTDADLSADMAGT